MHIENGNEQHVSIDWQLSVKLANNNKGLAKDLLEMFIDDLPKANRNIHNAYELQHYTELLDTVHRLHGGSCYCGVSKLKNILAKMESALREKMYPQFAQVLEEFDVEVNNVLSAYKMVDFA